MKIINRKKIRKMKKIKKMIINNKKLMVPLKIIN